MTPEQRTYLRSLPKSGGWQYAWIDRSGGKMWLAPIRQQCRRKGWVEHSPTVKRMWRITPAGLAALGDT